MGVLKTSYLFIAVLIVEVCSLEIYQLCSKSSDEATCNQLERSEKFKCKNNLHNIDCILNIEQGKIDFGRITPEEALVAANYVRNISVIGDFGLEETADNFEYETVVLVHANHSDGLKGLKGKKYCHPGFKFREIVSELVLKEFENAVLKKNNAEGCSNDVNSGTLLEKEVKALSEFFGPSCRPGPWIGLNQYDDEFYKSYPKLCELCSNSNKCTLPVGVAPFMYSLECMMNNGGDVALTTLNTVYEYFNRSDNSYKQANYKYLCRDGSTNTLDKPCTWARQPSNLIIANAKQAKFIKDQLPQWLPNNVIDAGSNLPQAKYEEHLKSILFPKDSQYHKIRLIPEIKSLQDYMKEYREIPNPQDKKCNQNVKWCTTSYQEQEKCKWLAQASLNRAIQPTLECVESESTLSCLEYIKNEKADIVTSDAHYGYIARRKNLVPLAYPETESNERIKPIVVIKASNDLNIEKFENLRNRKACLPEYGGIEWLSFIHVAQEHGILSKTVCDYGESISNFVGDSCMPGVHDLEHEKTSKTNVEKLCNLCVPDPYKAKTAKSCNTDDTNKYYGNEGALKCLKEVGDFAVVSKGVYPQINTTEFIVLCKNGSLALTHGFEVDDNCVLTSVIDSEVVSKRNTSKFSNIGIILLNLEMKFGTDLFKAFEVFNKFNDTLDLLFKDSTLGLTTVDSDKVAVKNYVQLFAHATNCTKDNLKGSAIGVKVDILPIIVAFILMLTMSQNF